MAIINHLEREGNDMKRHISVTKILAMCFTFILWVGGVAGHWKEWRNIFG
jgi:hypothetical protein